MLGKVLLNAHMEIDDWLNWVKTILCGFANNQVKFSFIDKRTCILFIFQVHLFIKEHGA